MSVEYNTWFYFGEKGEIVRDESYYFFFEFCLIQGYRMFLINF